MENIFLTLNIGSIKKMEKCDFCDNEVNRLYELKTVEMQFNSANEKFSYKYDIYHVCTTCKHKNIYKDCNVTPNAKCPFCNKYHRCGEIERFSCLPCINDYRNNRINIRGNGDYHIGVELELGNDSQYAARTFYKNVQDKFGDFLWIKPDCSIHCANFETEMVSQPATIRIHKNRWKELFKMINDNNFKCDGSCGLHFHFSRNEMTNNQIACVDFFINNYPEFIEESAGRRANQWCKFFNKTSERYGRPVYDRYAALNLQNVRTIEVRICASTLDYDTFMKRMKVFKNIVKFCAGKNIRDFYNDKDGMFKKFIKFNK